MRNVKPAACARMMLGSELINVSKPPTLVRNASTSRNGFASSSSRLHATTVSDPTMIIAVTLLRNALNSSVSAPSRSRSLHGSPFEALSSRMADHVKMPERAAISTKIELPMITPSVGHSIRWTGIGMWCPPCAPPKLTPHATAAKSAMPATTSASTAFGQTSSARQTSVATRRAAKNPVIIRGRARKCPACVA